MAGRRQTKRQAVLGKRSPPLVPSLHVSVILIRESLETNFGRISLKYSQMEFACS